MRKILIITLSCSMALLILGYTGYRGYHIWKEKHWMSMAQGFAIKSDGRNQLLCLQQVLRFNPKNFEACRMMAELTEAAHSPSALVWRQRVLELKPKSIEDRLALAKTCLIFRDFAAATNALAGLTDAATQTYTYHNLAGNIAIALRQPEEAQHHFLEAARLEPWNAIPQLNLAVVRLQGTNNVELAEARTSLRRLSLNSTNLDLRCLALRGLVADAMRFNQGNAALALSAELLEQTNSVFRDCLLRLDVLQATKDSRFKTALASFQRTACTNEGEISELATWQLGKMGATETLAWLHTLPIFKQTNVAVAVIMAEARAQLNDARGLQTSLTTQNWSELEFARHAFLSLAFREQNLLATAKAEWSQSLQAASNQKGRLTMLLQFAVRWKWISESEEVLWSIVNQYPEDRTASQALARALYESGRTRPLMSLYIIQSKRQPADLGIKNNLAMTALLLDAQELKPYALAQEIYQKAATNAAYASTYAFSLHLQKKDAEALKVMEQLKPKDLENPAIAGYYALVLKATGSSGRARIYVDWALKGRLLPEEKKLFEQARSGT